MYSGCVEGEFDSIRFDEYSCISGLHMHVGSLGMSLDQITQGARQLVALAEKINSIAGNSRQGHLRSLEVTRTHVMLEFY